MKIVGPEKSHLNLKEIFLNLLNSGSPDVIGYAIENVEVAVKVLLACPDRK